VQRATEKLYSGMSITIIEIAGTRNIITIHLKYVFKKPLI